MISEITTFSLFDLEDSAFCDPSSSRRIQLEASLSRTGCFCVRSHGIDDSILESAHNESIRFFRSSASEKNMAYFPNRGKGYQPLGSERLAASTGKFGPPDLRESYNVSSTPETDTWPNGRPGFRKVLTDVQREFRAIYIRLCKVLANALQINGDPFGASDAAAQSILRVNFCPSLDSHDQSGSDRVSEHTDFGTLSLLWSKSGCIDLEISTPEGNWISPKGDPKEIIVVAGDLLQRWTNGRWRPAVHRVVAERGISTSKERISLVYLGGPTKDTLVSPIVSSELPRFDPIIAKEYIQEKSRSCRIGDIK